MRNRYFNGFYTTVIAVIALMLASCEYDAIKDADYPDQKIYMPTASAAASTNFLYKIDAVADKALIPTPGLPQRYKIDTVEKKFMVPLSVYRAGINWDGAFLVNITANADTVTKLKASLSDVAFKTSEVLTASKYTLESSVIVGDGVEYVPFYLTLNLDSVNANYGKVYSIGVSISSTERMVNPKFATTIIVIDTKLLKPEANFTSAIDGSNSKLVKFTNSSKNSETYEWNFGDGSAISTDKAPSHLYTVAGSYTVTLTTYGVTGNFYKTGNAAKSVKTATVTIL